jgi:hypothetical protein
MTSRNYNIIVHYYKRITQITSSTGKYASKKVTIKSGPQSVVQELPFLNVQIFTCLHFAVM